MDESNVDDGKIIHQSETKQPLPVGANESFEGSWTLFYLLVITVEILGIIALVMIGIWGDKYMGGYGWDGSGKMFNYHPLFMILGFVFLYGNAAISYRVLRNSPKFTVKLIHGGIQCLSFLFAILGLVAVFEFHNHNKIPNMYSLHSWVGIATVVLFGCQLLFGFLAFLFPKFDDSQRKTYLNVHVFFGGVILAMAIVACVSGLTEKMLFSATKYPWANFPAPGNIANTIGLCLIAFGMAVGFIIYNPSYKRVESYEPIQ